MDKETDKETDKVAGINADEGVDRTRGSTRANMRIGRADLRGCGVAVLLSGTCARKSGTADPYGSSDVLTNRPTARRTCKQLSDRSSDTSRHIFEASILPRDG
jgi:hypothetical protein